MSKRINYRLLAAKVTGTSLLVLSSGANSAEPNGEELVLEEIIVTASKREANIQSVPISVTALSGGVLDRMGADSFTDFATSIAGISFSSDGPNRNKIIIRGVTDGPSALTQPITGIYVNETPVTFPGMDLDLKLVDIDRVEVLRGPQGTLYGAGSMGGTVKYVTNAPDPDKAEGIFSAAASSTRYGSVNYDLDGVGNIPLADGKMALRVVVYQRKPDGFIDDIRLNKKDVNDEDTKGGRLALGFFPAENLKVTATAMYQKSDIGTTPRDDIYTPDLTEARFLLESQNDEARLYNLQLDWNNQSVDFLSSTSYFDQDVYTQRDITALLPFLGLVTAPTPSWEDSDISAQTFIQEVRLSSRSGGKFNWLVGGYYSDRDYHEINRNVVTSFDSVSVFPFPLDDVILYIDVDEKRKEKAVFGEVSYQLTEKLEAVAGVRWFDNNNKRITDQTSQLAGTFVDTTPPASDDGFNPKFLLSYTPAEDALVYGQVSKGFRPGLANASVDAYCSEDLSDLGYSKTPHAKSDSLWSYELGSKTSWFNKRLVTNAAIYYVDWSDIQSQVRLPCGFTIIRNAGKASSQGAELETTALLSQGLQLSFGVAYIDAEIGEGAENLGGIKGERLPNVPHWSFSAALDYSFPAFGNWDGYLRADFKFVGERTNEFSQQPTVAQIPLESYTIGNLRIGLLLNQFSIDLFADNVFDERADLFALVNPVGQNIIRNRPRTIGIRVRYHF